MLSKPLTYRYTAAPSAAHRAAAAALRAASRALVRVARRLGRERPVAAERDPVYEFYAEAGAPEGALYVDGQLVGHLHGVNRL
jgi:hypothetical protein